MLFQQELWLIIVGLVVALVLRRTVFVGGSFIRIALWACTFSLIAGELGMFSTLFFPSDLIGLILTTLAAMMGARLGAKRSGASFSSPPQKPRSRTNKK
ncbi:hypothetical protein DTO96_101218 [Ephemeroptericola cinctiostellae]|uniref:Uncharacterized protein n=1 Tax=Ephemeroptericola cinctiostellae TaxID=2268024 RepID=A0A345DAU9_9BURK|nr:hypothetical protein [Ephemeroptericola cinctiostellae]AXF85487.1 hypothetical protein DTO96_101218 [Ephemeroptericola cinctiostellae]